MRLAAVSVPARAAVSTASLTASCSPKSSAVTMRNLSIGETRTARPYGSCTRPERAANRRPSGFARVKEAEELHGFAKEPFEHVPAAHTLRRELDALPRPEIKPPIEGLDRVIDLRRRQ